MSREPRRFDTGDGTRRNRDSPVSGSQRICKLCVETLPVDGAVIALIGSSGNRELVYGTDTVAQQLDELQFILGEGPCIDAFADLAPVLVNDLADETSIRRWPGFSIAAMEAGAFAAFAFPLQAGPTRFGVLELYRAVAGGLSDDDLTSALRIAESAVRVVLADVTMAMTQIDSRHRDYGRADIHQATGMIAAQLNVSIPEAFSRLRAAAFAEQRPIHEIARSVLDRQLNFTHRMEP